MLTGAHEAKDVDSRAVLPAGIRHSDVENDCLEPARLQYLEGLDDAANRFCEEPLEGHKSPQRLAHRGLIIHNENFGRRARAVLGVDGLVPFRAEIIDRGQVRCKDARNLEANGLKRRSGG